VATDAELQAAGALSGWFVNACDSGTPAEDAYWGDPTLYETSVAIADNTAIQQGTPAVIQVLIAPWFGDTYSHDDDSQTGWEHAVYGFPEDFGAELFIPPPDPGEVTQDGARLPEFPLETYVSEEADWWGAVWAADSTLEIPAANVPIPPTSAEAQAEAALADPHDALTLTPDETQDYAAEPTLDVTPAFFPPAAAGPSDAEAQAQAQLTEHDPYGSYGEETQDYAADSTADTAFLAAQEPDETLGAQLPLGTEWYWEDTPTEDYGSAYEVESLYPQPPTDGEIAAATGIAPDWQQFVPEETQDYQADSTAEVAWFFGITAIPTTGELAAITGQPDYAVDGLEELWDYQTDVPAALLPSPLILTPESATAARGGDAGTAAGVGESVASPGGGTFGSGNFGDGLFDGSPATPSESGSVGVTGDSGTASRGPDSATAGRGADSGTAARPGEVIGVGGAGAGGTFGFGHFGDGLFDGSPATPSESGSVGVTGAATSATSGPA
jgi:hypothetical protein